MLFKTNDLMRFLEIKHRYWKQFVTQLPKRELDRIKGLFRSDHKAYLFKSFD